MAFKPIVAPVRGRNIGIGRAATPPIRGRGIVIGRVAITPIRERGKGIGRDATSTSSPERGRCIGIGMGTTTSIRGRVICIGSYVVKIGSSLAIGRGRGKGGATIHAQGRGRGLKTPLSDIGIPRRAYLNDWFENTTIYITNAPLNLPATHVHSQCNAIPSKSSTDVTGDPAFKSRTGVRWKGKKTMTTNWLEVMRDDTRLNKR
ncbi:hypothetical protein RDI58_028881 [Solanum bulbocastanum]|uniref:Uncharacterized protein n=1 Tax=Solanum bulbocastanum TaxID=147425 RepID=A0AAN8SQX0_SOLBU